MSLLLKFRITGFPLFNLVNSLDIESVLILVGVFSSDDVAACKKLLEKVGLEGYQVHFWSLLNTLQCIWAVKLWRERLNCLRFMMPFLSQIGKTKVFLRAGQMADLDARRNEVLGRAATSIQRKFRSYLFRKNLMMLRKAAVNMQAVCRGTLQLKILMQL